jgi:transposase
MTEPTLFELPEPREPRPDVPTRPEQARLLRPCREQVEWTPRALDEAIPVDHPVRAIWALLERLDLSAFYASIKAVVDRPGHPATDPQVLLALWLYATTEGVGSARQLARLCEEHDAYRWLRGGVPTNYHTLSDFRVANQEALDDLLTQILASLLAEDLVSLRHVAQDGMRTRAWAGAGSFRRQDTLERCLGEAEQQVAVLAEQREHADPGVTRREQAARERAARERQERVEEALRRLPEVKAVKAEQRRVLPKAKRGKVSEPRVSTTDPEATVMKMPDGGFRPAYNLEVATDVDSQVIVEVGVVSKGSDGGQALPVVEGLQERSGESPAAYLMDGGFATREDVTALERRGIVVYAPTRPPRTTTSGRSQGEARPDDTPEVAAWRARMETAAAKEVYKERAATAECVNAHLRRFGMRQLLVKGVDKVLSVLLLVAISHDLLRWIALGA